MSIIQSALQKSKLCRRCDAIKLPDQFHRSAQSKDGLQPYCRECRKAISAEWLRKNKEHHRDYVRKYRQSNPHKAAEASRKYRKNNLEQSRTRDALKQKKNNRRYAEYAKLRFHRKRSNGGSYTSQEWRDLCDRFNNQCARCGANAPLTVDHIIPVSKGGTSKIDNLQPLCRSCNSQKGRRIIDYTTT